MRAPGSVSASPISARTVFVANYEDRNATESGVAIGLPIPSVNGLGR